MLKKDNIKILFIFAFIFSLLFMFGCSEKPYDINFDKYIKIGKYKELSYDKKQMNVNITKEDINNEINNRLIKTYNGGEIKEGIVEKGDTVNITYKAYLNDTEIEGISTDSKNITIGSGETFKSIENGLVGCRIGNSKTITVKMPKNYSSEQEINDIIANKNIKFVIKVNSKKVSNKKLYDKNFINNDSNGKCNTKKEYEKYIANILIKQKKEEIEENIKEKLWEKLVSETKVKKYPKREYDEIYEKKIEKDNKEIKEKNITKEQYYNQYLNCTSETYEKYLKSYSESVCKQEMIMYYIIYKEKLTVNNTGYEKYLNNILSKYGFTENTFKSYTGKEIKEYGKENELYRDYALNEILNYLFKNAVLK